MEKLPLEVEELIKFQNAYITSLHKQLENLKGHLQNIKVVDHMKTRKINNLKMNIEGLENAIMKYKKQKNSWKN